MPIYTTPLEICLECDKNFEVRSLVTDLAFIKREVVEAWVGNASVKLKGCWRGYLVNEKGDPTLMTTFNAYSDNWSRAFIHNPFYFNWFEFRVCDPWCRSYVREVRGILAEQYSFWDHDGLDNPRSLQVFKLFGQFFSLIEKLADSIEMDYGSR